MRRRKRIRAKVFGTAERPRLAVFKSNTNLYVQLINDEKGVTLATASSKVSKTSKSKKMKAHDVGKRIAETAKAKKITKVVFDRGGYVYTGKVKELADGAREGGLVF